MKLCFSTLGCAERSLPEILDEYIKFQESVIKKRCEFDLDKALREKHILEGYRIATENIDEVISIIKKSESIPAAKESLIERFGLSEAQAQAIVDMTLGKLSGKFVFVDNRGEEYARNGAYRIESAKLSEGKLILSVGEVSFIRRYIKSKEPELGYIFNIKEGEVLTIMISKGVYQPPVTTQQTTVSSEQADESSEQIPDSNSSNNEQNFEE